MYDEQEILEIALHLIMERDGLRVGFCNDPCDRLYYGNALQQGKDKIPYVESLIKAKELDVEGWVNTYPIGLSGTIKYLLNE